MLFTSNTQSNTPGTWIKTENEDARHQFRPSAIPACYEQLHRNLNSFALTHLYGNFSKQLTQETEPKEIARDAEAWTHSQIERLFKLYDYYGPQWKIMSQQMTTRTANNLKNRFYTVLRNLVKMLFRRKGDVCPKLSGEIPSKDLSRLYDGKQNYKEFKFLISTILQEISYNLDSEKIDLVANIYSHEIIRIYQAIYGERAAPIPQKSDTECQMSGGQQDPKSPHVLAPPCDSKKEHETQKIYSEQQSQKKEGIAVEGKQNNQTGYVVFFYFNPAELYGQQLF